MAADERPRPKSPSDDAFVDFDHPHRTSADAQGLTHELDRELDELRSLLPQLEDREEDSPELDRAEFDRAPLGDAGEAKLRALTAWNRRVNAEQRIAADQWALEIGRRLRGLLGPDPRAFVAALEAVPEEERERVAKAFHDRYLISLPDRARQRSQWYAAPLAGRSRELLVIAARNFVDGRAADLTADRIALSLIGRRPDALAIERVFDDHEFHRSNEIETSFERRHAARFRTSTLDGALERRLTAPQRRVLDRVRDGDLTGARIARLLRALGERQPPLRDIAREFEGLTPSLRRLVRKHWDTDPAAERYRAGKRLGNRATRDAVAVLDAELDGKRDVARTLYLRAAFRGHADTWIGDPFIGTDAKTRIRIIEAYDARTGRDFWRDLQRAVKSPTRLQILQNFILHGSLSDADVLRDCLHGIGTDRRGIRAILVGATKAEIEEVERDYSEYTGRDFITGWRLRPFRLLRQILGSARDAWRHGSSFRQEFDSRTTVSRDLWLDLELALDGDDWFDMRLARRGRPADPIARYEQLLERVRYERLHIWGRVARILSPEARALLRDVDRAREFYDAHQDAMGSGPVEESDLGHRQRLELLVRYAEHTFEDFRESKHFFTLIGSNLVAATFTAIMAKVLFATGTPLRLLMGFCGVISLLIRFGSRRALIGPGYSWDRVVQDIFLAAIDGVTFAAGSVARNLLGVVGARYLKGKIAERAVKSTSSFVLKRLVAIGHAITGKRTSMVRRIAGRVELRRRR